jgi:hypothetical protein
MAGDASESSAAFPLDSPNWWPWRRAIEHVRHLRINHAIADQELATAINERDVRCKMDWLDSRAAPPKRVVTLLGDSFFAVFRIEPGWGKLLAVAQRPDARLPHDHVLYAWGPHIERIWPTAAPSEPAAEKAKPEPEAALDESAAAAATTAPSPTSGATPSLLEGPLHPLRHGGQIDRVYSALRKEFPPFGKAPESLSIERIAKKLSRHWKTERDEEGLDDPSPEVVRIAVNGLGRSDD